MLRLTLQRLTWQAQFTSATPRILPYREFFPTAAHLPWFLEPSHQRARRKAQIHPRITRIRIQQHKYLQTLNPKQML